MTVEPLFTSALIPWAFLFISIFLVFTKKSLWPYGLAVTLATGIVFGAINGAGILAVLVLFGLSVFANKTTIRWLKSLAIALVIVTCIGLTAHVIPGFNNLLVLEQVQKSSNSQAFSLYLNFDKPMIIFALLLLFPAVLAKPPIDFDASPSRLLFKISQMKVVIKTLLISLSFIVIFSLAIACQLVEVEVKVPHWWWLFALNNLLLTCVAEEFFFRGYIQQKLMSRFSPIIGLLVASMLFGVAHFAGGPEYVVIAVLAGLLYGVVYALSGKLLYAILTHFSLNLLHLLFFTYPLLK